MNVAMWEHCTFDNLIFGGGKVYYSNPTNITTSYPLLGHEYSKQYHASDYLVLCTSYY
jgi:hypothetical protein